MRNLILLLAFGMLLSFSSCGGGSPRTGNSGNATDEATDESSDKKSGDDKITSCDDFIKKYEVWMDDYLKFLEDYMKNPSDASLATKYSTLSQEMVTWTIQWSSLYDCALDEKYEQQFDEIAKKAQKKFEELGFGQ